MAFFHTSWGPGHTSQQVVSSVNIILLDQHVVIVVDFAFYGNHSLDLVTLQIINQVLHVMFLTVQTILACLL